MKMPIMSHGTVYLAYAASPVLHSTELSIQAEEHKRHILELQQIAEREEQARRQREEQILVCGCEGVQVYGLYLISH